MTVTDAAGDASQYFFDDNGDLVKSVDPLGNVSFATYDSNWQPHQPHRAHRLDDDIHLRRQWQPDQQRPTRWARRPSYTYTGTDNLLASVTNAQGDTTNYNYNASGDLTSIEYPDDSVETATYDALGDPLVADRSGRPGDQLHL